MKILQKIDNLLNFITMYRLTLYYLIMLILYATVLAFFQIIPYQPLEILLSAGLILTISLSSNIIFSYLFKVPTNVESTYITALILVLIITPAKTTSEYIFIGWISIITMASKYILTIGKKHLFNPAAIGVVIGSIITGNSASWWIGNMPMMPIVVIGGLAVMRKIRRESMVITFIISAYSVLILFSLGKGTSIFTLLNTITFHSSLFFLGFVMLTEPLTTPATKSMQIVYAVLLGNLFAPQIHIGNIYSTPELALIVANIFSYLVSPKVKLILKLKEKTQLTSDIFDFIFTLDKKISFSPGQYMEWTLPHSNPDSRGNRRYFTIASSPTENTLRLGIKFNNPVSSYKKALLQSKNTQIIVGGQLAGDFVMPKNKNDKLAFIAGGIGITPYRSMLKYLIDKGEKRDIVVLYSNKNASEIVYTDVLTEAENKLGIKVIYTVTDKNSVPKNWIGKIDRINDKMIKEEIPDFLKRHFYLSGPHSMVVNFENVLKEMDIPSRQIKVDFFPGFT